MLKVLSFAFEILFPGEKQGIQDSMWTFKTVKRQEMVIEYSCLTWNSTETITQVLSFSRTIKLR